VEATPIDLPEIYHSNIANWIDESGVYPHQAMVVDKNGKIGVFALDFRTPSEVMNELLKVLLKEQPKEMIYGLDRFTKPNQGTTLGDVIAGAYWNGDAWRSFIIEYQHEPRIVKPLDWNNKFWTAAIKEELTSFMDKAFAQK
jgi:hypothetical protein